MGFPELDNKTLLIQTIVNSMNEISVILKGKTILSVSIINAIAQILELMKKVILQMPDVLLKADKTEVTKNDLVDSLEKVMQAWAVFDLAPHVYIQEWDSFCVKWQQYDKDLKNLNNSAYTIYLCMN